MSFAECLARLAGRSSPRPTPPSSESSEKSSRGFSGAAGVGARIVIAIVVIEGVE